MRKFTIAVIAVVALMVFSGMLLAQEQEHKEIKVHKEHKCTAAAKACASACQAACKGGCYGKCKSSTCLGLDAEQKFHED